MNLTEREQKAVTRVFGADLARVIQDGGLDLGSEVQRLNELTDDDLSNSLRCAGAALGLLLADMQMVTQRAATIAAALVHRREQAHAGRLAQAEATIADLRRRLRGAMAAAPPPSGPGGEIPPQQPTPAQAASSAAPSRRQADPERGPRCTRAQINAAMLEIKRPGVGGHTLAAELNRRGLRTLSGLTWTGKLASMWLYHMKLRGEIGPEAFAPRGPEADGRVRVHTERESADGLSPVAAV
jgi:hypothetical protein